MKSFLVALTLASAPATQATIDEYCLEIGNTAENVMQARQDGAALSSLIALLEGRENTEFHRFLMITAYDRPRYGDPSMQRREIQDFRNEVESACFRRFLDDRN